MASVKTLMAQLSKIAAASPCYQGDIKILKNGEVFYRRIEEAIQESQSHIEMEHYIFESGEIAERLLQRLREQAQQGVQVRVLADRLGSHKANKKLFQVLKTAGGEFHWYHPFSWRTPFWFNNRNHRNIITIDGHLGFTGGAGISDRWLRGEDSMPRWRDTMIEVSGALVSQLQETFEDNWRETTKSFHSLSSCSRSSKAVNPSISFGALVVRSNSSAHSSEAFCHLVQAAQKNIFITNPYFLPGKDIICALKEASTRGVQIKVLTAGEHADHPVVRWAARSRYVNLFSFPIRMYEYSPTMIHAKTMVVDNLWVVVGTSNFDNRSFIYNDEIDIVAFSRELAARVKADFEQDLEESYLLDDEILASPLYKSTLSRFAAHFIKLLA